MDLPINLCFLRNPGSRVSCYSYRLSRSESKFHWKTCFSLVIELKQYDLLLNARSYDTRNCKYNV